MKNLLSTLRGVNEAPRAVRSKMDTILITPAILASWKIPNCQRPLHVNKKVLEIADELKSNGGVISGVITLGTIGGNKSLVFLLDGQHRCEAAKISELGEVIADVRICDYDNEADMGDDWVKLNSPIVKMTPDNILHALENSIPAVGYIKNVCDFVGYDNIRRNATAAMLSMSVAIKCWASSRLDGCPPHTSKTAKELARAMSKEEYESLVEFLLIVRAAWGSDLEYARLWSALNLSLCMWLFRRLVLVETVRGQKRYTKLSRDQFKKCLMSLSATSSYLDWLVGRTLSERDRAPCLARIKTIFAARIETDTGHKTKLPQPAWATN